MAGEDEGDAHTLGLLVEAACKCYPNRRLILKWGAQIVERYEPQG